MDSIPENLPSLPPEPDYVRMHASVMDMQYNNASQIVTWLARCSCGNPNARYTHDFLKQNVMVDCDQCSPPNIDHILPDQKAS